LFSLRGIIAILLIIILVPPGAHAGDLTPDRLVRPKDKLLREQLAAAHLVRGEPFEIIAISPPLENASAADHFHVGMALSLTGRYIQASEAFQRAVLDSEPGSKTRLRSIEQFI
jgi:Flp pilus assembly protein TadD